MVKTLIIFPFTSRSVAIKLSVALNDGKPAYRRFWIRGLDQVMRHIEAVAFPLVGQAARSLGAVVIFWESQ